MPTRLIDFWHNCRLDRAALAHPEDIELLQRSGAEQLHEQRKSFEDFTAYPQFDSSELHLRLVPQPYAGDLRKAEIFVLLLNPGLGYTDYWGESRMESFRIRLVRNLRQELEGVEFPFLWLDPEICWHGGFVWWEKKLRDVISFVAEKQFKGRYIDALRDMSTKIASLELLPYHSFSFGAHKLIEELPSIKLMKEFVHGSLVSGAQAKKKTLIVTRQRNAWDLPSRVENIIIYTGGHTRGASLSTNSDGGKAILRHYGLSQAD